jgi:hypothetical protein
VVWEAGSTNVCPLLLGHASEASEMFARLEKERNMKKSGETILFEGKTGP